MQVKFRKPTLADAPQVHSLVDECKPLDLNSIYAYMLLCTHFAETCAVAEGDGRMVGFLSGYRKPADSAVLFVWQVAVSSHARGQGVGLQLIEEVFRRGGRPPVSHLETTITPSNRASWAMFESFARKHQARCATQDVFQEGDFGGQQHEQETLLRIGPFERHEALQDHHHEDDRRI